MAQKKHTTLCGVLMRPLLINRRAFILHQGQIIRTSSVVAIHATSEDQFCFETQNTIYTLLTSPVPQTPTCSFAMRLAA